MGASPAKFLFGFLFVSVVLWVIFMYVIGSNSRLKGYFSFVLIIIRLWNAVTCLIRLECSYDSYELKCVVWYPRERGDMQLHLV